MNACEIFFFERQIWKILSCMCRSTQETSDKGFWQKILNQGVVFWFPTRIDERNAFDAMKCIFILIDLYKRHYGIYR